MVSFSFRRSRSLLATKEGGSNLDLYKATSDKIGSRLIFSLQPQRSLTQISLIFSDSILCVPSSVCCIDKHSSVPLVIRNRESVDDNLDKESAFPVTRPRMQDAIALISSCLQEYSRVECVRFLNASSIQVRDRRKRSRRRDFSSDSPASCDIDEINSK